MTVLLWYLAVGAGVIALFRKRPGFVPFMESPPAVLFLVVIWWVLLLAIFVDWILREDEDDA